MGFYGDNFTNLKKFFYKVFFKGTASNDESFPTEEQTLRNSYLDITPLHAYDNVNIESGNKWVQFSPVADNDDASRNMGVKIYHAAVPEEVANQFFTVENITEREEGSDPLTKLYYGDSLKTKDFTFDKAGHIIAAGETTFTLPEIDNELNETSMNPVTNRVISQNLLVNESFENIVDGARPIQTQAIADKFEDVTNLYDSLLGQQQEDITKLETDPSWALYPRLGQLREEFNQFKEDVTGTEEGYTKPGYSIYIADPESEAVLFANGQFYKPLEGTEIFNDLRLQDQERDEDGNIVSFKLREGNVALGKYAHAEGEFTMALGRASHSQGQGTVAAGNYSHASGYAGFFRVDVIGIEENGTIIRYADYETDQSTPENRKYFSGEITYNCYIGYDKEIPENIKTSYPHNFVSISGFTTPGDDDNPRTGTITLTSSIGVNSVPEGTKFVLYQGMAKGDYSSTSGYKTFALGNYSNAQGNSTRAEGTLSHAEGRGSTAKGEGSHAEGSYTITEGAWSHAEGYYNEASGIASHVEGGYSVENSSEYKNISSGISSHAEGIKNTASGNYSHAEGHFTSAIGNASHAEGYTTFAENEGSHAEGYLTQAKGLYSHAEGQGSGSLGENSHAEGYATCSKGGSSHSEGRSTYAVGVNSHAEGNICSADGENSHAEGYGTVAYGNQSHSEGYGTPAIKVNITNINNKIYTFSGGSFGDIQYDTNDIKIELIKGSYCIRYLGTGENDKPIVRRIIDFGEYNDSNNTITLNESIENASPDGEFYLISNGAIGSNSHSECYKNIAYGNYSHASGWQTIADGDFQTVIGKVNIPDTESIFIIGNGDCGWSSEDTPSKSFYVPHNVFRVDRDGNTFQKGSNSENADYAEYFEWEDKNPNKEDRIGHFVTIVQGEYIKIATSTDKILGIVSGTPSIVGDSYEDEWKYRYMTDIYGRTIYEEVTIVDKDEYGNNITRMEKRKKLNPDYDISKKYIPRSQRPEWAVVGLLGKIVIDDDGTCVPGGYCSCNDEGIATAAADGYYVMKRLDDTHIQVLFK